MGGVPCIRELRIPVATGVGMVADWMSVDEVLAADTDLEPEDIPEALRYAAEAVRVHVREYDLQSARDREIFDRPDPEDRIVVSADTDFGTLLATRRANAPSVLLFRHGTERRAQRQAESLLANVDAVAADLEAGSGVVIETGRIRVRSLPIVT